MKILVTGGAGFIGSHVVDAYLALGHTVVVADDFSTGVEEFLNPRATVLRCDIRGEEIEEAFRRYSFDAVNHHAAQINLRKSIADPVFDASVNILGGVHLYELSAKYNVGKIIFASTGGAIYGEQSYFPADEDHPTNPASPYGIAKMANEKYLSYFSSRTGAAAVALRYTNVYGPRQNPHGEAGVVAIFADAIAHDRAPSIFGDGKQTRDYVFIEDVVRANVAALRYPRSGTFNICTGVETNVNHIYETLCDAARKRIEPRHTPPQPGELRRSVCTYRRAEQLLGWAPNVPVQEGLRKTAAFFIGRRSNKKAAV